MLPMVVTMFLAGIISGRIERTLSSKLQLVVGSAFSALAAAILALAPEQRWQIAVAAAVFGVGSGLAFSAMTNLIVSNVPRQQTGAASGMNVNVRTIGGSIGAGLMGSIVTGQLQPSGLPAEAGYTNGFLLLTGTSVAAVIAALIVPSVRRTTHSIAPEATNPQPTSLPTSAVR